MCLAKAKSLLTGYSTPNQVDKSDLGRRIAYDIDVVAGWRDALVDETAGRNPFAGRNVLELGPGGDLGTGVCLLAQGCASYTALDVHENARQAPTALYDSLITELAKRDARVDRKELAKDVEAFRSSDPHSRLKLVVRPDFDVKRAIGDAQIDLIVSQAAFEHFDNIPATFAQMTEVCSPGARLVAVVDLATHSRWIRDHDPNNIYRYSESFYRQFHFRGSPNRLRPHEYVDSLERLGWSAVTAEPMRRVESEKQISGMHEAFSGTESQMDFLEIVLRATR